MSLKDVPTWRGILSPNFVRTLSYVKPHRGLLWPTALFSLLYIPLSLFEPYLILFLVDNVLVAGRPDLIWELAYKATLFFIIYASTELLSVYYLMRLSLGLHIGIKNHQLDNLLAKSLNFFRGIPSGKILFSFFNDSNQIGALLSLGMSNWIINLLILAVRAFILWYLSPFLCLLYFIVLPLQGVIIYKLTKRVMKYELDLKKMDEGLTSRLESLLRGVVTVKAFSFGNPLAQVWRRLLASRLQLDFKNVMWQKVGLLAINNVQLVGSFAVLFVGAEMVHDGNLSLGALFAFITVTGRMTPALNSLIGFFVTIQEALVGIERYYRIFDTPDEEAQLSAFGNGRPKSPIKLSDNGRLESIEARDVQVFPGDGAPVLIPCDFTLRRGEHYLWFGPNGSGKTSLALAIAGLLPHTRGALVCGGMPLCDYELASVREVVLYVSHEPFWPERTLAENFTNSEQADELDGERLKEALSTAAADSILASLPLGMDTPLNGNVLSLGENQRLFLAMALYRRPEVLIMDEALSNVPPRLATKIMDRLCASAKDRMVVYITHHPDQFGMFDHRIEFSELGEAPLNVSFAPTVSL